MKTFSADGADDVDKWQPIRADPWIPRKINRVWLWGSGSGARSAMHHSDQLPPGALCLGGENKPGIFIEGRGGISRIACKQAPTPAIQARDYGANPIALYEAEYVGEGGGIR